MSSTLLLISDLYPASANYLEMPLRITRPSGSWGLPESLQIRVPYHQEAVPNQTCCPTSPGETLCEYMFTYLGCFLGQFLLYFGLFHVVLGFPILPLSFHPLPFFLLSLFFHFSKLPLHTTWGFHRSQHKPSASSSSSELPHRTLIFLTLYTPFCVLPVILGT